MNMLQPSSRSLFVTVCRARDPICAFLITGRILGNAALLSNWGYDRLAVSLWETLLIPHLDECNPLRS